MTYRPGPSMQIVIGIVESAIPGAGQFAPALTRALDALRNGEKPSDAAALRTLRNLLDAQRRYWSVDETRVGKGHYLRPRVIRAADPRKADACARVLARLEDR